MGKFFLKIVFYAVIFVGVLQGTFAHANETALIKEMNKHHTAKEYNLVFNKVDGFFQKENASQITAESVRDVSDWLQKRFIEKDQVNPLYGVMLAKIIASSYEGMNKEDPKHQALLMLGVTKFFISAIVNDGDIARCADKTSGQNYRMVFMSRKKLFEDYYSSLPRSLQLIVLHAVEASRTYEGIRLKSSKICRTGAAYFSKVIASQNYTTTEKVSKNHIGGKVQIIESEIEPDLVEDAVWKERQNKAFEFWSAPIKKTLKIADNDKGYNILSMEDGRIHFPDPEGLIEASTYFPDFKHFLLKLLGGGSNHEDALLYIPIEGLSSFAITNSIDTLFTTNSWGGVAKVLNGHVSDRKFEKFRKKVKDKYASEFEKGYLGSSKGTLAALKKITGDNAVEYSLSKNSATEVSTVIESQHYIQMSINVNTTASVKYKGEEASDNNQLVLESAFFPINGRMVNIAIFGKSGTLEQNKELSDKVLNWSKNIIEANSHYPRTVNSSGLPAWIVFALFLVWFLYRAFNKPKSENAKKEVRKESANTPIRVKDTGLRQELSASYVDLVEDKENKGGFLSQFAGYQNNSLKTLLKVILFIQCTAYWAMIVFLYNGLERVSYMMIFLFFASCLNILAVIRKDTIAQAWVPYLNGFGLLANLICFIYFYMMTAAIFDMTKGDAALIWIALGSLFVYLMPYSVPRERVSFFMNVLKNNLEGSPDQWLGIKNELRSKKEFKSLRAKLFNYKIEEPDKMKDYTEQVERSFRNEHGKPKQWVVEYLPRNSDTIALFSVCNISPTKATRLILADLENRQNNL